VFVVDDDASVREAVESLLRSVGLRVELFASAQAFLASEKPDAPACLVLDVRMPGLGGLDCQRQLAARGLPIPVVFMTGHGDIPMSVHAMKAGAIDFLTKPFRDQDLLDAVSQALELDRARRRADTESSTLRQRFDTLTTREQEVMGWVVSGRLNKQIAGEMGTSEITVKVHRGQMMRKMGADSVADLVRMASQLGLPPR
jgi:FixJ family two-component response regulator